MRLCVYDFKMTVCLRIFYILYEVAPDTLNAHPAARTAITTALTVPCAALYILTPILLLPTSLLHPFTFFSVVRHTSSVWCLTHEKNTDG